MPKSLNIQYLWDEYMCVCVCMFDNYPPPPQNKKKVRMTLVVSSL